MYKKILLACLVAGTVALNSCKPEEEDEIIPVEVIAPETTIPTSAKNVDGILMAINTISKTSGTTLEVGTAHAVFYKAQNPSNKVDGGLVSINSKPCTKSDDNVYFYSPAASEKNGIVYGSQTNWVVSGNTANGVSAIGDNESSGFPNLPSLSEVINMDAASDFQISWATAAGGDSILLVIKGVSGNFRTTLPSNSSNYPFKKAEIAKLGLGVAKLYVINYKMATKSFGGKSYAFIKQSIAVCNKVNIE